jgi:uncharacterized phage-associated protein
MITKITAKFDHRKTTQALNYFAIKEGGKINKMKALKLIFFADRFHLRKYGRLVTNDSYFAMENGPVASATRDIMGSNPYLDEQVVDYANSYITGKGYHLISKKIPDTNVFSESDLEAIGFAWNKFGHYDKFKLKDITHKYPEYISRKKELEHNSSAKMDFDEFFDDPKVNVDKCFELSDKDKKVRREYLKEIIYLESIWR